jgi:MFS family permease
VAGGLVAQVTNLGVPYIIRAAMLGVTLLVALRFMRDIGFSPARDASPMKAVRTVLRGSIDGGLRNPPVRWLMLAAPFTAGTGIYIFYAAQPYLLELYGDPKAYTIAGLAAAIFAGVQIGGGLLVPYVGRMFARRTDALLIGGALGVVFLAILGLKPGFVVALALLALWACIGAVTRPMRSAFLNGVIPSEQRATVLSFDSLMGSAGGVVAQPILGRVADVSGYAASYLVSAAVQVAALPLVFLSRREKSASDPITRDGEDPRATMGR